MKKDNLKEDRPFLNLILAQRILNFYNFGFHSKLTQSDLSLIRARLQEQDTPFNHLDPLVERVQLMQIGIVYRRVIRFYQPPHLYRHQVGAALVVNFPTRMFPISGVNYSKDCKTVLNCSYHLHHDGQ